MDQQQQQPSEEQLKAENDFLKMKLMLEKGAEFHTSGDSMELPPEAENMFLKNIMEFERQFDQDQGKPRIVLLLSPT